MARDPAVLEELVFRAVMVKVGVVERDLRETGEAEQTADIAILIHREDAYEPESARAGEVDLIIAKNRQGPQCTVTLAFQGHYGRIVSLGREWSPSSAIGENR